MFRDCLTTTHIMKIQQVAIVAVVAAKLLLKWAWEEEQRIESYPQLFVVLRKESWDQYPRKQERG